MKVSLIKQILSFSNIQGNGIDIEERVSSIKEICDNKISVEMKEFSIKQILSSISKKEFESRISELSELLYDCYNIHKIETTKFNDMDIGMDIGMVRNPYKVMVILRNNYAYISLKYDIKNKCIKCNKHRNCDVYACGHCLCIECKCKSKECVICKKKGLKYLPIIISVNEISVSSVRDKIKTIGFDLEYIKLLRYDVEGEIIIVALCMTNPHPNKNLPNHNNYTI